MKHNRLSLKLLKIASRYAFSDLHCPFSISFACQTACGCFSTTKESNSWRICNTVRSFSDGVPKIDSHSKIFSTFLHWTRALGSTSCKKSSLIGLDNSSWLNSVLHLFSFFAAHFLEGLDFFHLCFVNMLAGGQLLELLLLSSNIYFLLLCAMFWVREVLLFVVMLCLANWFSNSWLDPLLTLASLKA